MLTATAVCTAIDLHRLGVAILLFALRPDVAQLPSVTVSYTHLDVYKRQGTHFVRIQFHIKAAFMV